MSQTSGLPPRRCETFRTNQKSLTRMSELSFPPRYENIKDWRRVHKSTPALASAKERRGHGGGSNERRLRTRQGCTLDNAQENDNKVIIKV